MSDQNDTYTPCSARVGKGVITFACYLEHGHKGPHAALENGPSMNERRRWEQEQAEGDAARKILAESQGTPLTSAQGLHQTPPLPHPELRQPRLDPQGAVVPDLDPPVPSVEVEVIVNDDCPSCGEITSDFNDMQITNGVGETISCRQCPTCGGFFSPSSTVRVIEPEPTKQRPGDQPLPTKNEGPAIQRLVIDDIEARIAVGIERYGTPLQPFNGRDAILDAYEESLDLAVYLRQVRYEHAIIAGRLREMAHDLTPVQGDRGVSPHFARDLREMADALDPNGG